MRQRTGDRCTWDAGVQCTSVDKISRNTQCCAQDLIFRGGEGSQPGGSHTPLVLVEATPPWFSATQPRPVYESDQVTGY